MPLATALLALLRLSAENSASVYFATITLITLTPARPAISFATLSATFR